MSLSAVRFRFVFVLSAACLLAGQAQAHFPWLAVDDEGRALVFFGESPDERNYHLPEALAAAKLYSRVGDAEAKEVATETLEEEDFIGRRSNEAVAEDAVLELTAQYGIYHGMLLTYYAKEIPGTTVAAWEKAGPSKGLKLDVSPKASDEGLALVVTWEGQPLEGAGVALTDSAGETQEAETDAKGIATFKEPAAGPVSAITSYMKKGEKGEHEGKAYTSVGNYGTLRFNHKSAAAGEKPAQKAAATDEKSDEAKADEALSAYPALPEPVSSFGAAVCDGYLYIYSGHTGGEHEHSRDNLSKKFLRIKLDGGSEWEELPMETPLQGLPLVAHGGKLYRVGGLNAKNADGEDEDLHSVAEFSCYDPAEKKWTALAPLPEARSSHDAVVIGDKLYVVGGWTLSGDRKGKWLDTAWSFDLKNPTGKWEPIAKPNFRRRALAAAQWNGKLVALGGMDEDVNISRQVSLLDPATGEWTELAELPGEDMDGFGAAAWNLDGKLFASGTQESLYRLADDGKSWEAVLELKQPRFFHRLLPAGEATLLSIAGASFDGHLANIEEVSVAADAKKTN
jgi:N-acetylneuraminic acid mutarotase